MEIGVDSYPNLPDIKSLKERGGFVEIFSSDAPRELAFNLKRVLSYIKAKGAVNCLDFQELGYGPTDSNIINSFLNNYGLFGKRPEKNEEYFRKESGAPLDKDGVVNEGEIILCCYKLTDKGEKVLEGEDTDFDITLKIRPLNSLPNKTLDTVENIFFKLEGTLKKHGAK